MPSPIRMERWTSLRWMEKVWLCADFGQLYALLWVIAQPWPWPYLWISWTSWTVWMNLDYFSTTEDGALKGKTGNVAISQWGQMEDYLYYGLAFSALPIIFASPLLLWRILTPRQQSFVRAWVLFTWQMLYLPCGLGVFRLYYCESNDKLSADPAVMCTSNTYLMYTVLSTVLVAPLMLGLPIYMYMLTYDLVVYKFRHDHEKRVQAWEIMYGLGLDDYWLDSQAWIVCSFKRNGVYFRTLLLTMKMVLLLVFIFMRDNLFLQAVVYWLASIAYSLPALRYRPFRLISTNLVLFVLIFTLLCATTAGMMNAAGVQNAAMVASRESYFLWALFSFGVLLIGAIFILSYFVIRDDWPSHLTINRINASNMRPMVIKWINAIAEANYIVYDCLNSVAEIRDLTDFNRIVALVRSCWLSARANGSLFEVMLGEVLDKLLIFHKVFYLPKNIRRTRGFLHEALLESGESLLHRERNTILMARKKRSILTKMTAVRAFLGERVLEDSFNLQHNSLPRSLSGAGAHVDSLPSLHIYEPEKQLPSSDWGAEIDKSKELLEMLEENILRTEDILQSEDPSEFYRDMVMLREYWGEIVLLLDAEHLIETDLPENVKAEDCLRIDGLSKTV